MTTPVLGDVLLGAATGDREPFSDAAGRARAALGLPTVRSWCVVLVDGLGWHNLTARPEHAPFLTGQLSGQSGAGAPVTTLAATLPTSTATNLSYLGTARRAGATAMLGYAVRNPATGGLLNLISWNGGADPGTWQREPTVFEQMVASGRLAVSVGPWQFEDSGLTVAALRGAQYHPAESLPARVDAAITLLRDPEVDLVYLYWGELDSIAHQRGWEGPDWAAGLARLDTELDRLARLLPMGTGMLVTADHGMIDIPRRELHEMAGRIDAATHPELSRGVDLIGGEERFRHVYTREPEAVAARWADVLGTRAVVLTRAEALASDYFGPVAPHAQDIIGDVVVATQGRVAIQDSVQQSAASLGLVGMHGSTSAAEQDVPLVAVLG